MSKIAVLAEKPSVGKELARVLNCRQNKKSYFEGEKYLVTWAFGHLVTLANPEDYDDKYVNWDLASLPIIPERMKLIVIKKTGRHFAEVRKILKRSDISEIIIATDAGREGELVARWIIEKADVHKPLKRLWISSQTDKAIKDGFNHLQPGTDYDNLYQAAICRAEADWIVGFNVSRALTCKYNAQLSAGRVQSATLAMIVKREEEIKSFVPKTYYIVEADCGNMLLSWHDNKGNERIFSEEKLKKLLDNLKDKNAVVAEVTQEKKYKSAPALYDLTELQRDANKLFGFSAKKTLSIMQRLYENHKVLTYPRTDSRYLTDDIVPTLPERLRTLLNGSYKSFVQKILQNKIMPNKNFVNNSKVSDHHAIIPTEERPNLLKFTNEEFKIYDLVVKRFLSVLLPPFVYLQTRVTVKIGEEAFKAQGKVIQASGWHELIKPGDEEINQNLPVLKAGMQLKVKKISSKEKLTAPPARFNEGTLLSAMEKPYKYIAVKDDDAKILGETGGIGTVATRADIIEKLYNMYYIEQKGQEIIPTAKGKQLIDLVPEKLKSPILTAEWERKLEHISKGKLKSRVFLDTMKDYTRSLIQEIKASKDKFVHDNITRTRCPQCGDFLLKVKNQKGERLICQNRECGYKENIAVNSNARCPECHKKMKIYGQGEKKIFICSCGYREKLAAFQQRKKDNSSKMQKREISNYLKNQDSFKNNAFADAWAKLNSDK